MASAPSLAWKKMEQKYAPPLQGGSTDARVKREKEFRFPGKNNRMDLDAIREKSFKRQK